MFYYRPQHSNCNKLELKIHVQRSEASRNRGVSGLLQGISPGKDKFIEMKPYLWSDWGEPDYQ